MFPLLPETDTLALGGLQEFLDGATGFPGGIDLSPVDRAAARIGSVDPADNPINDVYARSVLPSFGPSEAYGLRTEFDGWGETFGPGTPTEDAGFQLGPTFGDYVGPFDPAVHTFVTADLYRQQGFPPGAVLPPGLYFGVCLIGPAIASADFVPILDETLLTLPFTIDLVIDRPGETALAEIRFFDGVDVAFRANVGLSGPTFLLDPGVDLRMFGQYLAIFNARSGDELRADFVDLRLGRAVAAAEPSVGALVGLVIPFLALRTRAPRRTLAPAQRSPSWRRFPEPTSRWKSALELLIPSA